jgi:hypothetical protein
MKHNSQTVFTKKVLSIRLDVFRNVGHKILRFPPVEISLEAVSKIMEVPFDFEFERRATPWSYDSSCNIEV